MCIRDRVYRARHLSMDRPVAIKFLHQRLLEDEAARGRFQTEARAAVKLRHPNAVSVTDVGQTAEGVIYIVMELLEGRTLREILSREAPLETARAISIMLQASDAVAAAHEAGIIHRDLKPANILVTQSADQPAVVKAVSYTHLRAHETPEHLVCRLLLEKKKKKKKKKKIK